MIDGHELDLNKLRVFVAVVEHGSLTATAQALDLPTSSVSRALSALEGVLGVRLLQRSPRATRLTAAGHAYYDQVRPAMDALEQARRRLVDDTRDVSGVIRVTASPVVAVGLLAPIIARFRATYPRVWFDVLATSQMVDLVRDKVDLALRARHVRGADLVARKLCHIVPRLYASPAYVERRGLPATVAALASHDAVVYRGHLVNGRVRLHGPRGMARDVTVRPSVVSDDHAVLRQAVLDGHGIGVVPLFYARTDLAQHRIVPVLSDHSFEAVPMWLVSPRPGAHTPARLVAFKEMLVEYLLALTAGDAAVSRDVARRAT